MKGPLELMRARSGARAAALVVGSLFVLSLAGLAGCSHGTVTPPGSEAAVRLWYCPMHPTQTSDRPGDCPICQMRLVPLERKPAPSGPAPRLAQDAGTQSAGTAGANVARESSGSPAHPSLPGEKRTLYRSTMIPGEVSEHPGKDSMGMEMVPVAGGPEPTGESPAGWSEIQIPLERLQKSGVTFGRVVTREMARTIRTVGRVAADETRVHHIHTKFTGWIEDLAVDYVGKLVRRGDLLFTVYSPELVATQEEYLQALRAQRELARTSEDPELARGAADIVDAARRRFELWDIGPAVVDELTRSGRVQRALPIYSPVSGIVLEKAAQHGMYVSRETEEFSIADLSRVWVLADVYESELSQVRAGERADVSFAYFPGRTFQGRIAFVYPTLEAATRTGKVRIDLANSDSELKPEMYANVVLFEDAGLRTVIPKSAVLMAGERAIAFLDLGEGRLAPRSIALGLRFEDDLEVLSGLSPGDRVVTSANFLVDSESRLRSALSGAASTGSGP